MNKTPETNDLARGNHVVPTEWAEQLERERDDAKAKYDILAVENMLEVHKLCKERDEWAAMCGRYKQERDDARAAIPNGEWVSYADYKKLHDAASRLLTSINKQLPIGVFTMISPEYYVLKDAIYGK